MIPLYLAGSSAPEEMDRVSALADRVEQIGYRVSSRWWLAIQQRAARGLADTDLTRKDQAAYASSDFAGVERARVLWLAYPHNGKTEGALAELGYAHALRQQKDSSRVIVVSGPRAHLSLFTSLADVRVDDDEEALAWLADYSQPRVIEAWHKQKGARQ